MKSYPLKRKRKLVKRCSVALFIIIIPALFVSGCGGKSSEGVEGGKYYLKGVKAYQHGNYKKAVRLFEKEIAFAPKNPYPYLAAGEVYEDYLKDKSKAQDYYLKFVSLTKDYQQKVMVLGWLDQSLPANAGDTLTLDQNTALKRQVTDLEKKNNRLEARLAAVGKKWDEQQAKIYQQAGRAGDGGGASVLRVIVPVTLLLVTVFLWVILIRKLRRGDTGEAPEEVEAEISGKYHWIEDNAETGSVVFSQGENGEVEVTTYDTGGEKKTSGTGEFDGGILKIKLEDDKEYQAAIRFRFHDRGRTFSAAWRDAQGTGAATGIREKAVQRQESGE